MARGRAFVEMGGFFTSIFPHTQGPVGAGGLRRPKLSNPRGKTLGWIGLMSLMKELFDAFGK